MKYPTIEADSSGNLIISEIELPEQNNTEYFVKVKCLSHVHSTCNADPVFDKILLKRETLKFDLSRSKYVYVLIFVEKHLIGQFNLDKFVDRNLPWLFSYSIRCE